MASGGWERCLDEASRSLAQGRDLHELGHEGVPARKDQTRHFSAKSGNGIITSTSIEQAHSSRFRERL